MIMAEYFFGKRYTKFHRNRQRSVEDIWENILVCFFLDTL